MPDDGRQSRILTQRENALKLIRELEARPNDPGLTAELENVLKLLNSDFSHDLLKKIPTNPDEWKKLTHLLEGEELFRVQVRGLEELQQDVAKTQVEPSSTIDSHDLKDVLSKQRETIKSLTEINQLRLTVKNSVENTLRSNLQGVLAADQIETLINHRGTKAELDKIINSLTLKPHQNIDSLSHAIAENLLHSSDQRLHLLAQLSLNHEDNIQKEVTQAIRGDKEVVKAFKHIEEKKVNGKASNDISELLKESVINDSSQQPILKPQLESILAKNNLSLTPLEIAQVETLLESHLLTHTSITTTEANALINTTLVQFGAFRQLSPEVQLQIASEAGEAFQTTFESMGKNEDIASFRTIAATNNIDSNSLIQNIATEGFTTSEVIQDAYDNRSSHGSSYNLNPHQLRLVTDAIKDPGLLQKPEFVSEFFGGTIESPNAMAQRWTHILQPSPTPQSGFISSVRSWRQSTLSRAQIGLKNFGQGARAFFEPIGKGLSKLGSGTLGTTIKNVGSSLGSFLKTVLPQLGKAAITATKALGSILVKVGAAVVASAYIWVPFVVIACILFLLFGPAIFPGAFSVARTNLTPLGAKPGPDAGLIETNPYIGAVKTASPGQFSDPVGTITYTYTITAKQGALTNVSITDQTTVSQKNGTQAISLTVPKPPETIETTWKSPTFTLSLKPNMDDSVITNTITVHANVNGSPQEFTTSASVLIGNPPTGCFVFTNPPGPAGITAVSWDTNPSAKAQETAAAAKIMAKMGAGTSALCGYGPIQVYLGSSGLAVNYGGWFMGNGTIAVDFKYGSLGSDNNALYTLAHETGHAYDERTGMSSSGFRQAGLVSWNGSGCTNNIYPFTVYLTSEAACYSENFAEGLARYINPAAKGSLPANWQAWYASMFE